MPIVIVGAGPVGLYTAICLAERGLPVQIVDKYANNFSRPGVVAIGAGEIITRQLKRIGIDVDIPLAGSYPETYYISDIQKILYKKAKELGVKFTFSHFKGIEGNFIKVEEDIEPIQCELLIDCSGESRQVVKYVNEEHENIFTVSQIADNPVKTNFIAFITMSPEDAELLSTSSSSRVNEVKQFEKLRAQGWTQNDMPHWDMRRWDFIGKKTRFSCYFEMPDELARAPESIQKEWLSTMLELKTGKKIDFEIESDSPLKFRPFNVDPHWVENPLCVSSPYPFPIAVCGDAMMSAEYRKGTGISNGIICANGLVKAISYTHDKYHIQSDIFYFTVTEFRPTGQCIDEHIKEVKDYYQARKNRLSNIKIQKDKLEKYLEAHAELPEDEAIKKGLLLQISVLKELADSTFLAKNYEKARHIYKEALNACKVLEENPGSEPEEIAQLYNLESRICSNLARIYWNQEKYLESESYLTESTEFCNKALDFIENSENEEMQPLKDGLNALKQGLEKRKEQYTPEKTSLSKKNVL
ncbi:hypothetical protein FOG18_04955 [Legionella israelensis]|uniref:FAD-dependent monooxygenase n=1 Tax=Legionella israelensis TaxID=454 RepID=UPI00117F480C|nr:FAD-dependent monooxygenase [Legionella israelensis]QDP71965.1 hypothetical protein FOG18_04955 [Legionella israelensis]